MKQYQTKAKKRNGAEYIFNVEEYGSSLELYNANRTREVTPQWKGSHLKDENIHKSFYGVDSHEEAVGMLRDGWAQEVGTISARVEKAATVEMRKRQGFTNDVVGFAPVVPLAMMNVPNSMLNTVSKPAKSKVVRICYLNDDSGSTSPEEFLERGAKIIEAIIALERSVYRCELYAAQFYCNDCRADTLMVRVKEANQPLDLKRVMFPLVHPAFERVIGFEWEDKCPTNIYIPARGIPFHRVNDHERMFKEAFGSEFVYIDPSIVDTGAETIMKKLRGEG